MLQDLKNVYLCRSFQIPGVLSGRRKACRVAEMIPVEPDQGNACAGKVILHCTLLRLNGIYPIVLLTGKQP